MPQEDISVGKISSEHVQSATNRTVHLKKWNDDSHKNKMIMIWRRRIRRIRRRRISRGARRKGRRRMSRRRISRREKKRPISPHTGGEGRGGGEGGEKGEG